MSKGTEGFPDLGEHCEKEDCNQLDFLPFTCAGCQKVYCLEHRTYKAHSCPKSEQESRMVVVCEVCSLSVEKKGPEEEKIVLERHSKSGDCDPSKKHKPRCPVKRCKELLTFSNTNTCKGCNIKVCLKHRFPSDHACSRDAGYKDYSLLLAMRKGTNCRDTKKKLPSSRSVTVS